MRIAVLHHQLEPLVRPDALQDLVLLVSALFDDPVRTVRSVLAWGGAVLGFRFEGRVELLLALLLSVRVGKRLVVGGLRCRWFRDQWTNDGRLIGRG